MKTAMLLAFLSFPTVLYSQLVWSKIYFNPFAQEEGTDVYSTSDGGFAIAGRGTGHLIKVNASGTMIIRQYFEEIDQAFDIVETEDEGYAILGYQDEDWANDRVILIRTDEEGNLLWSKTLNVNQQFASLISTQENGFAVQGLSYGKDDFEFYLLDSLGNIITQHNNGVGHRFIQLSNGDFVCANVSPPTSSTASLPGLIYLNAQGEIIWERELRSIRAVQQLSTGDLIVSNSVGPDKALSRYDLAGNLIWQKTYPELPGRIGQRANNRLLVNERDEIAFTSLIPAENANVRGGTHLAKFDADGNLLCTESYVLPKYEQAFEGLDGTQDFGFIISGRATRLGRIDKSIKKLYLIRTDSLCQSTTDEVEIVNDISAPLGNADPENPSSTFSFQYYPNPTSDLVFFEINTGDRTLENLNLIVLDMLGRTVQKEPISGNNFILDLFNFPSGTYYFEIYEGDQKLGAGKIILTKL